MVSRCPNGHASATDDFCDVCGEPIGAAASAPPAPAPAGSMKCPNCGETNLADALFCEECGYDFTTGQLPSSDPAVVGATTSAGRASPAAPATGAEWVAELWVDPDWFAAQEAAGTCATSGAPTIIPLPGTRALIGRRSTRRNIIPQIDCSADGSVSHEHADLTLDHDRWYIEDLGSTNGTYVGVPGDALPTTPLPPRERHELADGERIYLGAWCRIMIRRATDDEKAGTV